MAEDQKEIYQRLGQAEKECALIKQCLDSLHERMAEMQTDVKKFIVEASRLITLEGEIKALKLWVDQHKIDYMVLISEHRQCVVSRKADNSFWKQRAARFLDWVITGLIIWGLMLWKVH